MAFIWREDDSASDISVFDGRRVALSLPSIEDIMTNLSAIRAPNGEGYQFLTEEEVDEMGVLRAESDLFVIVSVWSYFGNLFIFYRGLCRPFIAKEMLLTVHKFMYYYKSMHLLER